EDRTSTLYRDILRLPAGHSMTVRGRESRVQPYCWLDPSREIRLRSDDEYADAFRDQFTDAVRCRLRSAFPVGSLLRGGPDWSSIVGAARRVLAEDGRRLHTFSAIFPGLPASDLPKIDERPFMEAGLAMSGLTPHYVHADPLSPLSDLDRAVRHQHQPVPAPIIPPHEP